MKTKENETVSIGKITAAVGIKGEVRATLWSHDANNLKEGKVLLLNHAEKTLGHGDRPPGQNFTNGSGHGDRPSGQVFTKVERVRFQQGKPVLKLEGVDDRNAAEALRNFEISIRAEDMEELPEGEHYVRDIIGCRVVDIAASGREIGILRDVIQNTAQSILEVETPEGKTVLIPAVDEFMRSIDEEAGVIEVELIPGFID